MGVRIRGLAAGIQPAIRPWGPASLWTCVVLLAAAPLAAEEPTTQATDPMRLENVLAQVRAEPILKVEVQTDDDKPLTSAQAEKRKQAIETLRKAYALADQGDFSEAARVGADATRALREVLGNAHPESTAAMGQTLLWSFVKGLNTEAQQGVVRGHQRRAEAAEHINKGRYAEAVEAADEAVKARDKAVGANNHECVDIEALRLLAMAQIELERWTDADASLKRALETIESAYGKNDPKVGVLLERHAWVVANQGDPAKAVEMLRRSVRILRRYRGENEEAARTLDTLGTVLGMTGDVAEALGCKARALLIRESLVGKDAVETGESLSGLAWLYSRAGRPADVTPLRERALGIFETELGLNHPYTVLETRNLCLNYSLREMPKQACDLLSAQIEKGDKDRATPLELRTERLAMLARYTMQAGEWDSARERIKQVRQSAQRLQQQGKSKPAAAMLLHAADTFLSHNMHEDAVPLLEEAVQWDQEARQSREPDAIERATQLALCRLKLGQLEKGLDLARRVSEDAAATYGKGEPRTGPSTILVARASEALGKLPEAEAAWEEIVKISELKLRYRDLRCAYGLRGLGRVYGKQQKLDLAIFTLEDARKIMEEHADPDLEEYLLLLVDLANCMQNRGDKQQAGALVYEALKGARLMRNRFKTLASEALLANVIGSILDVGVLPSGEGAPAREALETELREVLKRLERHRAIDGAQRRWLSKLGGDAAKAS